jgi:oligopeptide/dipeptide ABC transporter ATP-binding protein
VTIQAQILDLLMELRRTRGISIVLITHDLSIVAETCDRVIVLYAGKVVEIANIRRLFESPGHPYTEALLAALPYRQTRKATLRVISGTVPSGMGVITGCAFASRCPYVMDVCRQVPPLIRLDDEQQAACFRHEEKST